MEITQEWEKRLITEARKVVKHGFGKIDIQASNPKGLDVKVIIWAGPSYYFIVKKELDLKDMNII